jgi:hypothetical protein
LSRIRVFVDRLSLYVGPLDLDANVFFDHAVANIFFDRANLFFDRVVVNAFLNRAAANESRCLTWRWPYTTIVFKSTTQEVLI